MHKNMRRMKCCAELNDAKYVYYRETILEMALEVALVLAGVRQIHTTCGSLHIE